jgi:hypothetical protein
VKLVILHYKDRSPSTRCFSNVQNFGTQVRSYLRYLTQLCRPSAKSFTSIWMPSTPQRSSETIQPCGANPWRWVAHRRNVEQARQPAMKPESSTCILRHPPAPPNTSARSSSFSIDSVCGHGIARWIGFSRQIAAVTGAGSGKAGIGGTGLPTAGVLGV